MILVLAGTRDGRELAEELLAAGEEVLLSVVSAYGRELAANSKLQVREGALNATELAELLRKQHVSLLLDASHPYAANVSRNAITACEESAVIYLRFERAKTPLPVYEHLFIAHDAKQAAVKAAELGQTVFLTTGSHLLPVFAGEQALTGHRLIARVLPQTEVLAQCLAAGFSPRDIVAMQGPFSHELNVALFRQYGAEVVVAKNSGAVGGTDSKITAAMELKLPLVIIDRPQLVYPHCCFSAAEVLAFIHKNI